MKTNNLLLIGAACIAGYMLAPQKLKDQVQSIMPGGGSTGVNLSIGDLLSGAGVPSTENPFDLSALTTALTTIKSELPIPNLPEIITPDIPGIPDWLKNLLDGGGITPPTPTPEVKETVAPTGWEWFTGLPEPLQAATGWAALLGGTYTAAKVLPPATKVIGAGLSTGEKVVSAVGKVVPKTAAKFIPKTLVKPAAQAVAKAAPRLLPTGFAGALGTALSLIGIPLAGMAIGELVKPEWNWQPWTAGFWNVKKNWQATFGGDLSTEMVLAGNEAGAGQPEAPTVYSERSIPNYPEVPSKAPAHIKGETIGTPYGRGYSAYIPGF